ncbi:MAG: hypothetical protein JO257_37105 [Deltaproteobacteria bacterium]|nr:hypothetical protein [Deltaproteobacteria bacterium]
MRAWVAAVAMTACGGAQGWRVPAGWKHETIPFPLEFAPSLAHQGVEELRFPPGFMDARSANHWSYGFVWRLRDAAQLDDAALAGELTVYFRGLLGAVDGDKHRFDPAQISVRVEHGAVAAHVFDAFGDGAPIDLVGTAARTPCGSGSLWRFVLAPDGSPVRGELTRLVGEAGCSRD